MQEPLLSLTALNTLATGLDHPEGVAWGQDGFIYAGGEAGQIYRINPDNGEFNEVANTGGFILGLCLDADHNIYACDEVLHKVFRITPDGTVSVYSAGTDERPMVLPNYPVFDPSGNLYVSASGDWDGNNGCIYRVKPGGETEVISTGDLAFANGLAFDPDDTFLYVALSNLPGVVRFPIYADGTLGDAEHVIDLPRTVPDGLAFDAVGNLYITCYAPDRVYRLTPDGTLNILLEDWRHIDLCSPTNVAFYGADLQHMVIGSLGGMALTSVQIDVPGKPLHYPG
jgi:gluconolactonase